MPYILTDEQKQSILQKREERMKRALLTVDNKIIEILGRIHVRGVKTGLISNADIIDGMNPRCVNFSIQSYFHVM